MARFYGQIGYGDSVEDTPGVWNMHYTDIPYRGDILRNARNLVEGDKVNSDISISHSISVIADEFAIKHYSKIKYVRWAGAAWTVTNVEVRSPRLILSLGSVYNGDTA